MPIGGIFVVIVFGLLVAPLGQWFKKTPVVGDLFAQICRSTNADCNRPDLINNPESGNKTIFFCAKDSAGVPTTFARVPARGDVPVIKWTSNYFEYAGFPAQKRCEEVSERFLSLYNAGLLSYISFGSMNGENVICAAKERGEDCVSGGILFTLKPTEQPEVAIQYIFDIQHNKASGQASKEGDDCYTTIKNERVCYYTTSAEEKLTIDVEEALKKAPIATKTNW